MLTPVQPQALNMPLTGYTRLTKAVQNKCINSDQVRFSGLRNGNALAKRLVENSDKATDWKMLGGFNNIKLSFNLEGTQYTLYGNLTDDGKPILRIAEKQPRQDSHYYRVDEEVFKETVTRLTDIATPSVSKELGLSSTGEAGDLIRDLAVKTFNKEMHWREIKVQGKALEGADGAASARLEDGTRVILAQKSQFFGPTEIILGIQKPGQSLQIIGITSDDEKKALELFNEVGNTIVGKKELKKKRAELRDAAKELDKYTTSVGAKLKAMQAVKAIKGFFGR